MPPDATPPSPEREHTDESLRIEREKADSAMGDEPTVVDETADAVLEKARRRADAVLAEARKKSDRRTRDTVPGAASPKVVEQERVREDKIVQKERANADADVRAERATRAAEMVVERDETDKDLSRERPRSDHAVATRDEFLGLVSHDLRNMLGSMVGFAALIAKEESVDNRREHVLGYAQRIQRAGARMNRLIGDLIDVASIEAGRLVVTREMGDPVAAVTEAVEAFQAQASAGGVLLGAEIVQPLPRVPLDSARIFQVLINLLSNAVKFTPRGGSIVVHVERVGPDLCFAVRDTGVGIPADRLESVFERFVQIREDRRGMGLGLYISKCIVEGHGGRIWAESTLGHGSTFLFKIPLQAAS
ncbi:MAG: HAMP domain-containing sensor histidine kinase [Polyangiaceae bacterium]|jgi:signal transduction histidine kinase